MSIPSLEPTTITNLFANPDMAAGSGSVAVFEDLSSPVWRGDPDLVEVENADGTFSYFGTPVEGVSALRGVVVQSSQWSKSGGVSARFITTVEAAGSIIPSGVVGVFGSPVGGVVVWRRQEATIGEFEFPTGDSNLSILTAAGVASAPAANAPGETLMRVELEEVAPNGVQVYLPGGGNVGDSVWYDILTIVDDKNYDGPPFSGDSDPFLYQGQTIFPSWAGTPNHTTSSFLHYPALGPWSPSANWDGIGVRHFEAGVDKGMLYLDDRIGVPWSGLVSVDRTIEGESHKSYYIDGQKFYIDAPPGDFSATIEAYTYPEELEQCLGSLAPDDIPSLSIHHQPIRPFHFAYRTLIGNDVEGTDFGYKIHLVYNAYARPTQSTSNTLSETTDADVFSWEITTVPEHVPGFRPTSYFSIDSRRVNSVVLENLERVLYGANGVPPRLPSLDSIMSYLESNS